MVSTTGVKRKASNTRTPKSRSKSQLKDQQRTPQDTATEPPPKKRKYVPGGPGGGGRYIEISDNETPVRATARSGSNHTQPRTRPIREASSTTTPRQPPSTPSRQKRQNNHSRRFSSAAAAVLAVAQGDGYKPREEKGWEEFHPDLDLDARIAVFDSRDVDGLEKPKDEPLQEKMNGSVIEASGDNKSRPSDSPDTEGPNNKRRPGRPRRTDSGNVVPTSDEPKIVPPPEPNPREKLTLPKPSWVLKDPFLPFEQKGVGQQNYVDRTMASVGYQESDIFLRHERRMIRMTEGVNDDELDLEPQPNTDVDSGQVVVNSGVGRVEYDMDEQDAKWLETYNAQRKLEQFEPIKPAIFEITMTKIEKEWHALERRIPKPNPKPPQTHRPRSSSAVAVNGEIPGSGEEQDSKCAVCDDGDCENSNAIVFCDGCDLAVHQECYGVPFIPEGQWLCRKCQLIGRGSPSCIFCPNTEGAFKQTNTSKWSHLLCAVWIPEVSIGNPSLMEPVNEVEKVPRSRWKLNCYVCRQKMGACIQCSNKNCFTAFHPTCGRRARLYLKMKLTPGAPAVMDSNGLKAFCDKHVPSDWRIEQNTDAATADALEYYRTTMQGRRWGDSQALALALEPDTQGNPDSLEDGREITPRITLTVGSNNRRKRSNTKTIWKLPSGAPIIPQIVLNNVIASLARFTVRHRKQYAEDACKYWTLKREARRGAALLKRLQLQLETFSSMEMTRRNFAGMGPAGTARLERRIDFADKLYLDVDKIRILCDEVKKREKEKLKDAELLQTIVDIVYFPIPPLLWPVFEKTLQLDGRGVFRTGFQSIRQKLEDRCYTSISDFSRDLAQVFTSEIGVAAVEDTAELQIQISGRAPELSIEQRDKRKLAKRIIKAVQPLLEDALKKESELNGKPYEHELKGLDLILENSVGSRRGSINEEPEHGVNGTEPILPGLQQDRVGSGLEEGQPVGVVELPKSLPHSPSKDEAVTTPALEKAHNQTNGDSDEKPLDSISCHGLHEDQNTPYSVPAADSTAPSEAEINNQSPPLLKSEGGIVQPQIPITQAAPPTPPASFSGSQQLPPLAQGGIQWYMQPFDPIGTTIHEERWTGREVLRGMSEELSDMEEEELRGLVGDQDIGGPSALQNNEAVPSLIDAAEASKAKTQKSRRRWRGFR
ncbi:nuA3 HAT complex component nto1 [Myotisia sp. PD_48]|nr:nuA3 HAT complex component nto1 [Myotisia sp. PD_48]